MKDVQCCEPFGGRALETHAFSFFYVFHFYYDREVKFRSQIEYGMNDICMYGKTFGHR